MNLELRHLRYFVALAEELNFARAAARLNMTQPPLSQQILQMEAEIGAALFVRGRRPLRLTAAGLDLLEDARRLLTHADSVMDNARRAARGERGTLVVAFIIGALPRLLPNLLNRYRAQYPGVRIDLREMVSPLQCEALASGEIDVGVMRPMEKQPAIRTLELVREEMLLALPHSHALATRTFLNAEEVCHEPFIAFSNTSARYFDDIAQRFFRQASKLPEVVQVANQLYTVLALVAGGIGVALVPESARHMAFPNVAFVRLAADEALHASLVLGWNELSPPEPVLEHFIAIASASMPSVQPLT
ncbi:hypothetical protein CAL29_21995 [Bordetella genomosp. 10]|uniref:HTH lysR-type domain-containing protein n=1 Tax=Bordetella genomosp. 10 TaxID=1416804 RepID=A0A261S1H8_9BORD|nr:LysR substrate-binding domain-containing protein [Bordetella genomosp. 10]OZI30670.1 hypothetical protein CAL29_21995 [Bordetella genomosp. 10]